MVESCWGCRKWTLKIVFLDDGVRTFFISFVCHTSSCTSYGWIPYLQGIEWWQTISCLQLTPRIISEHETAARYLRQTMPKIWRFEPYYTPNLGQTKGRRWERTDSPGVVHQIEKHRPPSNWRWRRYECEGRSEMPQVQRTVHQPQFSELYGAATFAKRVALWNLFWPMHTKPSRWSGV